MSYIDDTLVVGTSVNAISVTLTAEAILLLDQLPTSSGEAELAAHRALLTTITVGKAAAGKLHSNEVVIDADDIRQVLDHAGTARHGRAL